MQTKYDSEKLTVSNLEILTGVSYKTIVKRLKKLTPVATVGREIFYNSHEALLAIYDQSTLDLNKERARLAKMQADKIEIEIDKMSNKLVDTDVFIEGFSKKLSGFRDKLLNMALRLAGEVTHCHDLDQNYNTITELVEEALNEITAILKGQNESNRPA